MEQVYFSFDIEADGASPMNNSLLSVGIVVFDRYGKELDSIEVNIEKRDEAEEDENTMKFWEKNPEAWNYCHQDTVSPTVAMEKIGSFYEKYKKLYKINWVAGPACFDWMFLKVYYSTFKTKNMPDIGYSCNCLSERKRAFVQYKHLTQTEFNTLELYWSEGLKGSHKAIDDARVQGKIYCGMISG